MKKNSSGFHGAFIFLCYFIPMNLRLKFLAAIVLPLAVATRAADRPLQIDSARSKVEFAVKATGHSFVGSLDAYEVNILIASNAGKITGAALSFRCADLKTGKAKRDKEMLEWLHNEQFPDARFELVSLDPVSEGHATARGKLTFHGVTKPLEFPVAVLVDGEVYAIDGEAVVDHREFDLPLIRKFAILKVDPLVRVRFHLQGTRAN